MNIASLLTTLLPELLKIMGLWFKVPSNAQDALVSSIRIRNEEILKALEKAKNEKDPSHLSDVLNKR